MLAIRAGRMFDGVSPELMESPVVVVDKGQIVEVLAGAEAPRPAELVDLGDATLLPGLIDTHAHLVFNASDDPVGHLDGLPDETLFGEMRQHAREILASGVTTIRDVGDRGYLSLRVRAETAGDPQTGPTVLAAGPPITTPRGHCWFLGGEVEGVDAVRAAVRERVERGVDVIKVMASGGGLTPGSVFHAAQFGPAELRAMVDEAHRHGRPITAHAHAVTAIADAVAAGFDCLEHCSFATEDGVGRDDALIAEIAAKGVAVSTTLGVLPDAPPPPPPIRDRIAAVEEVYRAMRDAGVTFVCGSDNGMVAHKPHDSFGYSVADMIARVGLTPLGALRSATSLAAQTCRVADRKGSIAPGMDADLVAVAGDPLADIAALRSVVAVFRAGQRIEREHS